jgi:hypothetical protein
MPTEVIKEGPLVSFTPKCAPYMPTPMKLTESSSALWGCIGLFRSAISQARYKTPPLKKIEVDVHATLMIFSLVLIQFDGKGVGDPEVLERSAYLGKGGILERYRGLVTNM